MQSTQPSGSGSPYQVHKYSFYVVVNSMAYCCQVSSNRFGNLRQEGIAHLPCCLFRGKAMPGLMGTDIARLYSGWDVQLMSQLSNIPGVGFGLSTSQLVVEVSHVQLYTQSFLQVDQYM